MLKPVYTFLALALSIGAVGPATAAQGGWRPGPGWDRDVELRCESRGHAYKHCQIDTGRGGRVSLVRQLSNAQCVEGRSWGWNRGGVWVDRGCSGVFRVHRRWEAGAGPGPRPGPGGGWRPGPGWEKDIVMRCGSPQYQYAMCQVDTGRGSRVYMRRQLSDTRCVEGRNWGWNRGGIWVDKGCSGEFVIERRWR